MLHSKRLMSKGSDIRVDRFLHIGLNLSCSHSYKYRAPMNYGMHEMSIRYSLLSMVHYMSHKHYHIIQRTHYMNYRCNFPLNDTYHRLIQSSSRTLNINSTQRMLCIKESNCPYRFLKPNLSTNYHINTLYP